MIDLTGDSRERNGEEWVTVSEAARRLGVSDRQAHRYAGKLSDIDRQKADTGPLRVRLSALRGLRNGRHPAADERESGAEASDTTAVNVRPVADIMSDTGKSALIEQLRADLAHERQQREAEEARHAAEVERLNTALERSQTLQLQTLGALTQEQQRVRELEAQAARLIEALPSPSADPRNGAQEAAGDLQSDDSAGAVHPGPEAQDDAEAAREREREELLAVAERLAAENRELKAASRNGEMSANVSTEDRQQPSRRWWQVWRRGAG